MSFARVIGMVLLIAGGVLIIFGVAESRSLANSLSSTFRGSLTQHTLFYFIGGVGVAVIGLVLMLGPLGRSRS